MIVLAEGLAESCPRVTSGRDVRRPRAHLAVAANMARQLAKLVAAEYEQRTGKKRRVTGVQLGYESRCALPHAFDVMLGSQLGVGAYRALVENQPTASWSPSPGSSISTTCRSRRSIDPETLVTVVRYIQPDSDFHRLARFLENYPHD